MGDRTLREVTNLIKLQASVGKVLHFCVSAGAATADFDGQMWIADNDYELIDSAERHQTAGAAANIQVFKVPSGTAKASGTNMLSTAGHSAAGTADTVNTITATTTLANARVTRGDSIAIVLSAASAALDGVTVTVRLKAISSP